MIEERLKERLVGAVVLTAVAVIFIPLAFQGRPEQAPGTKSRPSFTSGPQRPQPSANMAHVKPALAAIADQPSPASAPHRPVRQATATPPGPPDQKVPSDRPQADGGRTGWVVQLASFSREANAKTLRAKLIARGFAAFIDRSGPMYRVRVGPTSGQQQARDLRAALKLAVNLQGVVIHHP